MYEGGRGAGLLSGATSTVAGSALLPNTNGNIALLVLSIVTITAGVLSMTSFVLGRTAKTLTK